MMRSLRNALLVASALVAAGCPDDKDGSTCDPDDIFCTDGVRDTDSNQVIDTEDPDDHTDDETDTDTDRPIESDPPETDPPDTVIDSQVDSPIDSIIDSEPPDSPGDSEEPIVGQINLNAGDLVITEFQVDPQNCTRQQGQYVEIKNARTDARVNLRGLRMKIGSATLTVSATVDVIVEPGDYAVAETTTPGCDYSPTLASNFTFNAGNALPSAGDTVELITSGGRSIDSVNFRSIRMGGGTLVTVKGRAVHLLGTESSSANDVAANWCMADTLIPGATVDYGSPFAKATSCYVPPPPDSDSDVDTTITDDTVIVDSDTGEGLPVDTDCTKTVDQLQPGDLVVTEIMIDPAECGIRPVPEAQDMGRWIELRNVSGCRVDVSGLSFTWGAGTSAIPVLQASTKPPGVTGDWIVEPYEYFTVQRELSSHLPCHSYGHEFAFGNQLSDSGRMLTVRARTSGTVIDTVDFTGFDLPLGRSIGLDRWSTLTPAGATANDDAANWCPQDTTIKYAFRDKGTPNAANRVCPSDTLVVDTFDSGEPPPDTCKLLQTNNNLGADGLTATELCPGDLMITEIMVDPLTCSKPLAQYVEFKNTTDSIIYPSGLYMQTRGAQISQVQLQAIPLVTDAYIRPGEYGVAMMYNLGVSYCHDASPEMNAARKFRARSRAPSTEFQLAYLNFFLTNGQGTSSAIIDKVDFSQFQGLVPAGEAVQIKPGTPLGAEGNNDRSARWCWGGPVIPRSQGGSIDHGTPGAPSICDIIVDPPPETDDSVIDSDSDTVVDPPTDEPWIDSGVDTFGDGTPPTPDVCAGSTLTQGCLKYNDLVITEVMFDPIGCSGGASAKYIEVYNPSATKTVDPRGLRVRIGDFADGDVQTVDATAVGTIGPKAFKVLRLASAEPFCFAENTPALKVTGVTLDAKPSFVRLFNDASQTSNPSRGDILVDAVDMRGWENVDWGGGDTWEAGFAIQLNPTVTNRTADANDLRAAWCPSGKPLTQVGAASGSCIKDYGSPGTEGTCGTFHPVTGCLPPPTCPADKCLGDLKRGDLVITEIHANPNCTYRTSEFVEVFNASGGSVELKGMQFSGGTQTITVSTSQILGAGQYGVFTSTGTPRCYAATNRPEPAPIARWNQDAWDINGKTDLVKLWYTNSAAEIVVIDQVPMTSQFPSASKAGGSLNLDAEAFGAATATRPAFGSVANDSPNAWCITPGAEGYQLSWTTNASLYDFATPGAANHACRNGDTDGIIDDTTTDEEPPESDFDWTPIEEVRPGDLVVTEVMVAPTDCSPEASAEYIEVYNTTTMPVNLRYLELAGKHGGVNYLARVLTRAIVMPKSYAILANISGGEVNRCYGDLPFAGGYGATSDNGYGSLPLQNDGQSFSLRRPDGTVLDGFDYAALPRQVGASWELAAGVLSASLNDDVDNWCLAKTPFLGSRADLGTPNAASSCSVPGVDSTPDTDLYGGPWDQGDTDPDVATAPELNAGDLVITEILVDSAEACGDVGAEWFELYNATASTVDLYGLTVENRSGSRALIGRHVLVASGGSIAFARYDLEGRCYLDPARVTYAGMLLDNDGDLLRIRAGGRIVDEVDFRSWAGVPTGASLQLDPDYLDATSNDARYRWCTSTKSIAGAELDKGTPDRANPRCAIYEPPADTDGLGTGDTDSQLDTDYPMGDTDPVVIDSGDLTSATLQVGNLVITEALTKPVACGDARGEYIELYNPTAKDIDLFGVILKNGRGGQSTIGTHTALGAGRYALAIRADADPQCYDLGSAASRGVAVVTWTGFDLRDAGDQVTVATSTRPIDTMDYAGFPLALYGASWNLDRTSLSAIVNDLPGAWCASTTPIPSAPGLDLGTPGFSNEACSVPVDTEPPADTADTFTPIPDAKTIDQVAKGELLLSELHVDPEDCSGAVGQYVEVYNHGTSPIDLNGLVIGVGANMYQLNRVPGRTVVLPGEVMLAKRLAATDCYPQVAEAWSYRLDLPGAGIAWLADGTDPSSRILDLVDYRGFAPALGAAWMLRPERYAAVAVGGTPDTVGAALTYTGTYDNNAASAWCAGFQRIPGARSDRGSPGLVTPRCLAPGEDPRAVSDYVSNIDEVRAGELVITELMPASRDCSDIDGEYLEVTNVSPYNIDLYGLVVRTTGAATSASSVTVHKVVAPGETVLGRRADTGSGCYVASIPDFVVPGMSLDNDGGSVAIWNSHSAIDTVDYTRLGVRPGRALSVVTGFATATANDNPGSWCYEPQPIPNSPRDQGSPGVVNGACTLTAETKGVSELGEGDLIIAEYLYDSDPADCDIGIDQFVEVLNTSPYAVNVRGLRLNTLGRSYEFTESRVIDAGAQAVMFFDYGCFHYRVPYDVKLADATRYPPLGAMDWMQLRVDADRNGVPEVIFDEVDFRDFGVDAGASVQLKPEYANADDNDDVANWCVAEQIIRGTEHTGGTPRAPNDCGPETDPAVVPWDTAPDEPIDTGFVRIALRSGEARVAPGGYFRGKMTRAIANVGQRKIESTDLATMVKVASCAWQWTATEVRTLPTASICPTCEFAFEVRFSAGVDLVARTYGRPSVCGNVFAPWGGVAPNLTPTSRLYFSSAYDTLYLQNTTTGALEPYADPSDLDLQNLDFAWRSIVYSQPVP